MKETATDIKMKTSPDQPKMEHHGLRIFIRGLCSVLLHLLYRIQVIKPDTPFPEGPVMIVANHRHYFDVVAVHVTVKRWIYWIAKKNLFSIPVLGSLISKIGAIPVDRDKTDIVAARGIFGHLKKGDAVGIFPQGTRVPDSRLAEVMPRSGAAHFAIKTDVPLVPVWVDPFRLFRTVRVIYGEPFRLEADPRGKYSPEELEDYSCELMNRIFSLAGLTFPCKTHAQQTAEGDKGIPAAESEI
jgi:1-acyl-sn-glycerol-3-phosphate acyltransferase